MMSPLLAEVDAGDATSVPPIVTPIASASIVPRRVKLLKAVLLFWILPRRFGTHLAAGRMRDAMLASLISSLVVPITAAVCYVRYITLSKSGSYGLHRRIAAAVLEAARDSATPGWGWTVSVAVFGGPIALLLVAILLGTVAAPWCAAGDWPLSVWKRSVKLALWTESVLL